MNPVYGLCFVGALTIYASIVIAAGEARFLGAWIVLPVYGLLMSGRIALAWTFIAAFVGTAFGFWLGAP